MILINQHYKSLNKHYKYFQKYQQHQNQKRHKIPERHRTVINYPMNCCHSAKNEAEGITNNIAKPEEK
jgi:hypothetical protein